MGIPAEGLHLKMLQPEMCIRDRNGWLYLYYSDGYTFIIEYPSVSGRYFYGTAEDGFEIRLEWVDGRSIRKKVS